MNYSAKKSGVNKKILVPVVEGFGEVESTPLLLRRLFSMKNVRNVEVAHPYKVQRNKMVRQGELEKAIRHVAIARQGCNAILVLLDADDDCPAKLGPSLEERAPSVSTVPVRVVLANREFEAWFLGAKESLRGIRGIRGGATAPAFPEAIWGAGEHLSKNMLEGRRYLGVDDQPAFAAKFDLDVARQKCPSFDKFVRSLDWLLDQIFSTGHYT